MSRNGARPGVVMALMGLLVSELLLVVSIDTSAEDWLGVGLVVALLTSVPYLLLCWSSRHFRRSAVATTVLQFTALVLLFSALATAYYMFTSTDAQTALAILVTPVYQLPLVLLVLLLAWFISRGDSSSR